MMATGTALLVSSLIGAGTAVGSAAIQSKAAKDAAKTQVAGAKDAQGYIDRAYAQGQAALQPWLATGSQAATTLGGLMGLSGGGGGTSAPTATAQPYNLLAGRPTGPTGDTPLRVKDAFDSRYVDDTAAWRDDRRADRRAARLGETMTAAEAQTQSSYVKMQAPDGTTQDVPSSYVNHYTQLGARVVS